MSSVASQLSDIGNGMGVMLQAVLAVVIVLIFLGALYNMSVHTSGANSTASKAIASESQSVGLFGQLLGLIFDPTVDIVVIVAGFAVWLIANYKPR